jgi:hypothetical protein
MHFLLAGLLASALLLPAQTPPEQTFDLVVVSGSSGGFGAALAAGRMGLKVALVEDTPVLGGMLANGISNIDTYSYESLSGIFDEFRLRVREHYRPKFNTDPVFRSASAQPPPRDYRGRQSNSPLEGGRWEPHVADRIFKQMIAGAPSVHVFYRTWATGVVMRGNRILGVTTEDASGQRRRLLAPVVIDATHEADIAAWAGAPYRVGREPRSAREPHAGDILYFNGTGEIMEGSTGRQDQAIVSYGLRLCIRHYGPEEGDAHLLRTPPPGYDPANYRLAGFGAGISMPGQKTEMNANPAGNELQFINWTWPEATRAERAKLYETFRNHALGFLYYVQHERGWKHLGLPRDEFVDNDHVPYRVFVREARRIEGEAMMDEADVNPFLARRGLLPELRPDTIAIGHYAIDSKPVLPKTDASTPEKGPGDFFLANIAAPFQVPFGAIVPRQIEGLLVPVALSATHVAFSAVRMDPTWMALGQAAGTAAALAVRRNIDPRHVPVAELQRELIRRKAKLLFYWDVPAEHPAFAAIQWLSARRAVQGFPDRLFRPDQALTRAELATLAFNAFNLWPSVSDFHFRDVPAEHWAFREVETLLDNRLLGAFGVRPRWPEAGEYKGLGNAGFSRPRYGDFGDFLPDRVVNWGEFASFLGQLRHQPQPGPADWLRQAITASEFAAPLATSPVDPNAPVTRGQAVMVIAAALEGR